MLKVTDSSNGTVLSSPVFWFVCFILTCFFLPDVLRTLKLKLKGSSKRQKENLSAANQTLKKKTKQKHEMRVLSKCAIELVPVCC